MKKTGICVPPCSKRNETEAGNQPSAVIYKEKIPHSAVKLSFVYGRNISVSGLSGHSHIKRDLAFRITDVAVSGLVLSYILLESLI